MLFAGDHIMNGSTVVIVPPSGDMQAYIASLKLLLDYPLKLIAPGHGEVMEDSAAVVEWLVDHRLQRESKVVRGLESVSTSSLDELVKIVYDDVDESLYPMAKLSLHAHLIKLEREARASHNVSLDVWELVGS